MKVWSFFDTTTGCFTGTTYTGSQLERNTPLGCSAVRGEYDPLRQRVDIATGEVIAWQPPAPPNTDMQTFEWKDARWVARPTAKAIRLDAETTVRAERARRLADSDWIVTKTFELQTPLSAAVVEYRQALRDVPAQPDYPFRIVWPETPSELSNRRGTMNPAPTS